jgi:hypothetical protein
MKIAISKTFISILLISLFNGVAGQDELTLRQRPGTFEILRRTDFTDARLGFSKADNEAAMVRIENLVKAMRKNEVLEEVRGFNGRARIHNISSIVRGGFGVPSRVSFEFSSFFYSKTGKVVFNTIEPPEWSVYINCPNGIGISSNAFDLQKGFFTIPLSKKTIAPGVDVYDEVNFVLYDPDQPDYWIPVTVDEAFSAALAFSDKEQDTYTRTLNKQFLDKEWNDIPASARNKPAYYGGGLSRVTHSPDYGGERNLFPPIMKVNPAYWNKSFPKGTIQLITFTASLNKDYLRKELENCYRHANSGSGCDLQRFNYAFKLEDILRLAALVGK